MQSWPCLQNMASAHTSFQKIIENAFFFFFVHESLWSFAIRYKLDHDCCFCQQKQNSHSQCWQPNKIGMEMSFFYTHELNKDGNKLYIPSSSISMGSGRAGFVSGLGSISPGRSFRGSSPSSFSPSLAWAWSLDRWQRHQTQVCFTATNTFNFGLKLYKKNGTYRNTDLQKKFISFQALRCCTADERCNCSPLSRHQLCQMKQFFIFFTAPLSLQTAMQQFTDQLCWGMFSEVFFQCIHVIVTTVAMDTP